MRDDGQQKNPTINLSYKSRMRRRMAIRACGSYIWPAVKASVTPVSTRFISGDSYDHRLGDLYQGRDIIAI